MTDMTNPQPAKGFCQVGKKTKIREKLGIGGGGSSSNSDSFFFFKNLCILWVFFVAHVSTKNKKMDGGWVGGVWFFSDFWIFSTFNKTPKYDYFCFQSFLLHD